MYDNLSAAELAERLCRSRIEAVELARAHRRARQAELEASRPVMPPVTESDNPVITFTKYQSGREYHYAAIGWRLGKHVRWAVTGTEARRFNWAGLLAFIGEANWSTLAVVEHTRHLLPPGSEPAAAETIGRYGRVVNSGEAREPHQWPSPGAESDDYGPY